MLPEPNTRHIEEARALLISQYRGKPVIQGLLDSYIRPLQPDGRALLTEDGETLTTE